VAALAGISAAVLTGAFAAGDSLKGALRRNEAERLGRIGAIAQLKGRFLDRALLARAKDGLPGIEVSGALLFRGRISLESGPSLAIDVVGVDETFFTLKASGGGGLERIPSGMASTNAALSRILLAKAGDAALLSLEAPGKGDFGLPLLDSPRTVSALFILTDPLPDADFGRFSLSSDQRSLPTLFVDSGDLGKMAGLGSSMNAVLAAGEGLDPADLSKALNNFFEQAWDPRWAGFSLGPVGGLTILRSPRVFFDPEEARAIEASGDGIHPVAGYFLDSVSSGPRSSPFAFVASVDRFLLSRLAGREYDSSPAGKGCATIRWLAQDLGLGDGQTLSIDYRVASDGSLVRKRLEAQADTIIDIEDWGLSRELMPLFPGMAGKSSCSVWDPGIPLDLSKLRPRDEAYWNDKGGAPKLFFPLGESFAGRGEAGDRTAYALEGADQEGWAQRLSGPLSAKACGLSFVEVRGGERKGPIDFGSLFAGLSMFLALSPLILIAFLFSSFLDSRAEQIGILRALGYGPWREGFIRAAEIGPWAIIGAAIGSLAGLGYAMAIVMALNGPWSQALQGVRLAFAASPSSIMAGFGLAIVASFTTIIVILALRAGQPPASLLRGESPAFGKTRETVGRKRRAESIVAIVSALALFALTFTALRFYSAALPAALTGTLSGTAVLAAGLLLFYAAMSLHDARSERAGILNIAVAASSARKGSSLMAVFVVASGSFIVNAIGANPWMVEAGGSGPASGTGGFNLVLETALPFGKEALRSAIGPEGVFLAAREIRGDDVSCLNVAGARSPALIGIDPPEAAGRFSFAVKMKGIDARDPFGALDGLLPDGAIPVIADSVSLEWNLGLAVGDSLEIRDEVGRKAALRIVASLRPSVFQSELVLSRSRLSILFPSGGGNTLALIRTGKDAASARQRILDSLRSRGPRVISSQERLTAYSSVEGAYLKIFYLLGSLGLLLGAAGAAAANALRAEEDRAMGRLLRCLGFSPLRSAARGAILSFLPIGAGIALGSAASVASLAFVSGQDFAPLGRVLAFPSAALLVSAAASAAIVLASALRASRRPSAPAGRSD
jgi:hypothetical protein